jgi:hypothetical protein
MLTLANSLDDDALFDFFHDYIVGITGLANESVLPRWQLEPPNIPTGNNWCAFGITGYETDTFVAEVQKSSTVNEIHRHEMINLLISFYGDNPIYYARVFRDGIQVSQNMEMLNTENMSLISSGDIIMLPTLLKERWLKRVDMPFTVRRQVVRGFPVLSVIGSNITVNNEKFTETIVI